MIEITMTDVYGLEPAIRGMRNSYESHDKIDSAWTYDDDAEEWKYEVGSNDMSLMKKLASAGRASHAKYRRMIAVYADIKAPLYWWKEFDTYKVGTVRNSYSTMHTIHKRDLCTDDFSFDHMDEETMIHLLSTIELINRKRVSFLDTGCKKDWYSLIQILPESYNQKSTVMLNYEVLSAIYKDRKDHRLDEWHVFCDWIKGLPESVVITTTF